jgi:glycosyltransferase involved in cell wall biosynthesis
MRSSNGAGTDAQETSRCRPRFLLTFLAWVPGFAGGDRHLLEVASRWREHVDISVVSPPQAFPLIESFLGGVEKHPLGSAGPRAAARGPILALEYIRRGFVARFRCDLAADVVVAASHFSPDSAALAALAQQGRTGVSYVYHLVADRQRNDPRTIWSKADERVGLALLRRHADLVFVSNRPTASALAQRGFSPVRTDVGLDLGRFRCARRRGFPPHTLFLARMVTAKGVIDAVTAWARVREAVSGAKLVMAGAGPEQATGQRHAERLGIADSIEWTGLVSEEEKGRLLARSRVLLAPSYEEGWGIAVGEALATGLPVVGYRLPVLDELFPSAYLGVRAGDVGDLARAVIDVLTDDALADELSHRGRRVVERYDLSRVAELELEQILRRRPLRHGQTAASRFPTA